MTLKISYSLLVEILYWILIYAERLDPRQIQIILSHRQLWPHKIHLSPLLLLLSPLLLIKSHAHLLVLLYYHREVSPLLGRPPWPSLALLAPVYLGQAKLRVLEHLPRDLGALVPAGFLLKFEQLLILVEEIVHSILRLVYHLVLHLGLPLQWVAVWDYWFQLLVILLVLLLELHHWMRVVLPVLGRSGYLRLGVLYSS